MGERSEVYWISGEGSIPQIFHVVGEVAENPARPERPLSTARISVLPLLKEDWLVKRASTYGQVEHGAGFANTWEFRHRTGESILIETERAWDGGDDFLTNKGEKFARLLAQKLGWHFLTD